jgi:hypothetical protein
MKLFGFKGNLRVDFVVTNQNRLFEWLRILSTSSALFVFLFSIVSPFYNWSLTALETSTATYWSYRANHLFFSLGSHSWQYWFFNYWFDANHQSQIGILGMDSSNDVCLAGSDFGFWLCIHRV